MFSTEAPFGAPHPAAPETWPGGRYKSRSVAGLLTFFLGIFGAHDFYLGRRRRAVAHLAFGVLQLVLAGVLLQAFFADFPPNMLPALLIRTTGLLWLGNIVWVLVDFVQICQMRGLGR